jgi:hypothetical protein
MKDSESWKIFICLKEIYPAHKRLFCDVLDAWDASIADVVAEAKKFEPGDSLQHITSIFHAMSKFLEDDETAVAQTQLRSLKFQKIFPVSKSEVMPEKAAMPMSLKSSDEWFIADTEPLNTKFRGLVPLLDIKVDDLTAMHQLGQQLDLGRRLLSKEVSNIPRTSGVVELDQELTDTLRSKVDFIIRLLPTTKHLSTNTENVDQAIAEYRSIHRARRHPRIANLLQRQMGKSPSRYRQRSDLPRR